MYNGIKRKQKLTMPKRPNSYQILITEQVELNGSITEQYVIKTFEPKTDDTITFRDFDIRNLLNSGINMAELRQTSLRPTLDMTLKNANAANTVMEYAETIKQIEEYDKATKTHNEAN